MTTPAINACIAWENLGDDATVTASSYYPLMRPEKVQDPHVARKWRAVTATSEYLTFDLGSSQTIDTVALMGLNMTSAGTTRLRLSVSDSSAITGDAYDSGSEVGKVDSTYGYLVYLLASPVSARYGRIGLTDATVSYIEAGRLFVGTRIQFGVNIAPGYQRKWIDPSQRVKSIGQQTYIDDRPQYRSVSFELNDLTETEALTNLEALDVLNGLRKDVLFVKDPTATNLGKETVWGLLDNLNPLAQRDVDPRYSRQFTIDERL